MRIFSSILRRAFPQRSNDVKFSYEEKKYSPGVIVLVIAMTVLLVMLGERALGDVSDGIPPIAYPHYGELAEEADARIFYEQSVVSLEREKYALEEKLRTIRGEYDSSLLENLAEEETRLYGEEAEVREQFRTTEEELGAVAMRLTTAQGEYERLRQRAESARTTAMRDYERRSRWRQLHVFAWEALFWIPLFAFSVWWYTSRSRRCSAWEIVSLSLLIAASVLALQSVSMLLWSWLPRALLEWLWRLLRATLLTRVVGYYLLMMIAVICCGGLIVFLHRRLTDPVRWGKRKIRHQRCPTCAYPLALSQKYCGGCGTELTVTCPSCQNRGHRWQARCIHCGTLPSDPLPSLDHGPR